MLGLSKSSASGHSHQSHPKAFLFPTVLLIKYVINSNAAVLKVKLIALIRANGAELPGENHVHTVDVP